MNDDGDFSKPGTGGNIPAGEVFISPLVGKCQGVIVYDGSMTFSDGDSILETPITCKVENGYVTEISGGEEAKRLLKTIHKPKEEGNNVVIIVIVAILVIIVVGLIIYNVTIHKKIQKIGKWKSKKNFYIKQLTEKY